MKGSVGGLRSGQLQRGAGTAGGTFVLLAATTARRRRGAAPCGAPARSGSCSARRRCSRAGSLAARGGVTRRPRRVRSPAPSLALLSASSRLGSPGRTQRGARGPVRPRCTRVSAALAYDARCAALAHGLGAARSGVRASRTTSRARAGTAPASRISDGPCCVDRRSYETRWRGKSSARSFIARATSTRSCTISAGPMSVAFAMRGNQPNLTGADLVATGCFVAFLALEAAADQQQWRFQQAKREVAGFARERCATMWRRGFLTRGLFKFSGTRTSSRSTAYGFRGFGAVRGVSRKRRGFQSATSARAARRLGRRSARALVPRIDAVHGEHHDEEIPRVRRVPKMHVAARAVTAVRDHAAGVQAEEAEGLRAERSVTSFVFFRSRKKVRFTFTKVCTSVRATTERSRRPFRRPTPAPHRTMSLPAVLRRAARAPALVRARPRFSRLASTFVPCGEGFAPDATATRAFASSDARAGGRVSDCAKTVVLADAGHGVGRALLASLLAYPDCRLTVAAATPSADLVASLRNQHWPECEALQCEVSRVDLGDDADVARWRERVLFTHGTPDVVIANVGCMPSRWLRAYGESPSGNGARLGANGCFDRFEAWHDGARPDWSRLMNDVKGVGNVARQFLPAMVQAMREEASIEEAFANDATPDEKETKREIENEARRCAPREARTRERKKKNARKRKKTVPRVCRRLARRRSARRRDSRAVRSQPRRARGGHQGARRGFAERRERAGRSTTRKRS